MCGHWMSRQLREPDSAARTAVAPGAGTRKRQAEDLVGDAERRDRADLVGRAYAEGLLDVGDMERALEQVLRARTVGELDAATALLPAGWVAAARRAEAVARRAHSRRLARRQEVRAYLGVMTLLVGIWLVTAVTAGAGYFWPIWPALGWGIPLLLGAAACGRDEPAVDHRTGPEQGTGAQLPASSSGSRAVDP